MKLIQNEFINIIFITSDVTMTSLGRHNYEKFQILRAKLKSYISGTMLAIEFVYISFEIVYKVVKDDLYLEWIYQFPIGKFMC